MTFVCRVAVISLGFVRSSLFMLKEESSNEMTDCTKKNTADVVEKRGYASVHVFSYGAFNLASKNVLNFLFYM